VGSEMSIFSNFNEELEGYVDWTVKKKDSTGNIKIISSFISHRVDLDIVMTPKPQSEQTFLLYINGIYLANFDMENRIQDNYALELSQSNNLYIGEVRKCQTNKLSVNILKYDESDLWWQWKVDKNEVEFK